MGQLEIAAVQLILALLSGSVVSGITLFKWGVYAQRIRSELEERTELIRRHIEESNDAMLHKLTILEKDLNHAKEITALKTENDINNLRTSSTQLLQRVVDIERYLTKTNGFKIRERNE